MTALFETEHGVSTRTRWDGKTVFSVDGTHFHGIEARRRIRNDGYEIVNTESHVGGDHYTIIAERK